MSSFIRTLLQNKQYLKANAEFNPILFLFKLYLDEKLKETIVWLVANAWKRTVVPLVCIALDANDRCIIEGQFLIT